MAKWIWGLALSGLAGWAQGAVLVTDVSGKARVAGANAPLATLASIEDGKELSLPEGGRLVAVDLVTGAEFVLHGPGSFLVQAGGPKTLKGGRLERSDLPAARLPKSGVAASQLSNATIVMRDIQRVNVPTPQAPVRTMVATLTPLLRWAAVDGATEYQVAVSGPDGGTVHFARAEKTELVLPAAVLEPGRRYQWRIEAVAGSQRIGDASAHFTVLPAETLRTLDEARESASGVFSRRVLYALQLQDAGAFDEARQVWRALAAERPGDAQLKQLAK